MAVFHRSRQQFLDDKGRPFVGGLLYIGEANQDPELNPITVTDDEGNTLSQPITLDSYGRTPERVNLAPSVYSYRLKNSAGVQVEDEPEVSEPDLEIEEVAGTSYTIDDEDTSKLLLFTSSSAVTVTLSDDATVGTQVGLQQFGTGTVSVTTQTDTLRNVDSHSDLAGQYAFGLVYKATDTEWVLVGYTA